MDIEDPASVLEEDNNTQALVAAASHNVEDKIGVEGIQVEIHKEEEVEGSFLDASVQIHLAVELDSEAAVAIEEPFQVELASAAFQASVAFASREEEVADTENRDLDNADAFLDADMAVLLGLDNKASVAEVDTQAERLHSASSNTHILKDKTKKWMKCTGWDGS